MTTAGGGGFIEGDDYVALRLNLDIPETAAKGVKEIADEVERYTVAMEAAIRAEADMASYAEKMSESVTLAAEAQTNMTEQLEAYLKLTNQISSQGQSSGVPAGPHKAPWEAGTPGMGAGASPVPPGARMPNPSDVIYQLGDRAGGTHQSAAGYLNMHHQRGNVPDTISISPESIQSLASQIADRERALGQTAKHTRSGQAPHRQPPPAQRHPDATDVFDQFEHRVQTATGLAGQVMNEVGAGGGGLGQMAVRGMDWARKKLEERAAKTDASSGRARDDGSGNPDADPSAKGDVGELAGLAKMLGVGGGAITAALAAFALYEKGGQMVQGWRNIASPRGGGAGEGFMLSMRQRMLSMDPNITTEQSREMYQAMLSEGYADASGGGRQSDEVLGYLKTNVKQYNMSVSESMQLLKLTAHTTKVSVGELNDALYVLQQTAKDGTVSQGEMQRQFRERWAQLESQGVPERAAMKAAQTQTMLFSDNPLLAGVFGDTQFSAQMGMQESLFGGPGGTGLQYPDKLMPQDYARYDQTTGRGQEAQLQTLKHYAEMARDNGPDTSGGKNPEDPGWIHATGLFAMYIQDLITGDSPLRDMTNSNRLYNQLIWGIGGSSDPKQIVKQAKGEDRKKMREMQRHPGGWETVHTPFGDFPNFAKGVQGDSFTSRAEDNIINAYGGADKIEVKGKNGKWEELDPTNAEQMLALDNDQAKWRHKGDKGEGLTLNDTPASINDKFSTDDPTNPAGLGTSNKDDKKDEGKVTGTLTIKIDRNGNVSAPGSVPLTANEDAAKKGSGDAQMNDPPILNQLRNIGNAIASQFGVN